MLLNIFTSHQANTYKYKSPIEKLERDHWNIFKVNDKGIITALLTLFQCLYCQFWADFTPFCDVSIADLEQLKVSL